MIVNVSEAKAKLSKLIDMVCHGEKVVLAKNNLPLVDIVPHRTEEKRALGLLRGEFTVPDSFCDESSDINTMFYGDDS
ncbi:MAG: type II toxin-antitoxin system prevent-host-death family antitoxin [Deltaproteobacteria bacterium]|nr:type II toxin-antitoxin system prevent-host-death family antitoxin [Deltaproteobacteria bacterium]MBN2674815.1 type II toxin-antitoxin system prevent-host-death family antitoxin [Deltaproteobacteria bacterium]